VPGSECTFGFDIFSLYTQDKYGLPVPLDVDYTDTSQLHVTADGLYKLGDIYPLCHSGGPDGIVDPGDVLLALSIAGGQIDPATCPLIIYAGDINGDGSITSADASLIARIVVGKPVNPGPSGLAKFKAMMADAPSEYVVRAGLAGLTMGGTAEVFVTIDNGYGISAADLQLNYDPSVVKVVGIESQLKGKGFSTSPNLARADNGVVTVSMAAPENLASGGGKLFSIKFQAADSAGPGSSTPIILAKVKLFRQYGEDASWDATVSGVDGRICVVPPYDIDGDGQTGIEDLLMFGRQWLNPFDASDLLDLQNELGD